MEGASTFFIWMGLLQLLLIGSVAAGGSNTVASIENFHHMKSQIPRENFRKLQRAASDEPHELVFAIKQRNMEELERSALDRSSPRSPNYQKWMSFDEVGELCANPDASQAVLDWLSAAVDSGIEVTWMSRRREYIKATAPIRIWEQLLDTQFFQYEDHSRRGFAKKRDRLLHRAERYSLPADIKKHITAVFNTVQTPPEFKPKYHRRTAAATKQREAQREEKQKQKQSKGLSFRTDLFLRKREGSILKSDKQQHLQANGVVTIAFLNNYYKVESNEGSSSQSQSVFETADEYFSPNDLKQFQQEFDLTVQEADFENTPNNDDDHATNNCNDDDNDCYEGNLDIQYIMGMSQKTASIYWYTSDSGTEDPFVAWITAVADESDPPQSNSISWGAVEQEESSDVMDSFNTEAVKLANMGVTITVSSGDDGAANGAQNCNRNSGSAVSSWDHSSSWTGSGYFPSFPASSPYVTAVGATQGPEDNDDEIACQSQKGGVITSGGGFSTYFSTPSWQEDTVAAYFDSLSTDEEPTDGYNPNGRGYPDLSLIGVEYQVVVAGDTVSLFGTSCSSPVIAAWVSLVNSYRADNGLSQVGFLNPTLYDAGENSTKYFNDITSGKNNCQSYSGLDPQDNAVCCNSGFQCSSGWDPVTGWGSMDFTEFSAIFDVSTPYTIDDDYFSNGKGGDDDDDDGGLSSGEIAAVVICTILGAAICVGVGYRAMNPPPPSTQQQGLMANPDFEISAVHTTSPSYPQQQPPPGRL